jgi:imidazolonepropionase-like amidohydrolase
MIGDKYQINVLGFDCSRVRSMNRLVLITFQLCLLTYSANSQTTKSNPTLYLIKNVNVISMTIPDKVIYDASVVISNNVIESINGTIPPNCKVIEAKGKWLIPGLIDAHVHLPTDTYFGQKLPTQKPDFSFKTQDVMTPFIANGVTTVVDLNASMETFGQKKEIEKGWAIGPRIALAALVNGGKGQGRIANTAEEGRFLVRTAKAEGYDFIKVYSKLNVETYTAILDESNKLGIRTIGHIPDAFQGNLEQAFVPHLGMIAHAEELSKHAKVYDLLEAMSFAKLAKDKGTALLPTLTTMVWIAKQSHSVDSIKKSPTLKYVHPLLQSKWLTANNYANNATKERVAYFDTLVQFHYQLVKAFKEAGVPMVAGSDTGVSGVVPGFSLHDELEELVKSGLTPYEALASATITSAQWIGNDKFVGSIEDGKLADLVLLNKNPLVDIRNSRSIEGVFVNGIWLDKKSLGHLLADLAKRNTKDIDKFDWVKTINGRN